MKYLLSFALLMLLQSCDFADNSADYFVDIEDVDYVVDTVETFHPTTYEIRLYRVKRAKMLGTDILESYRDTVPETGLIRVFGFKDGITYQLMEVKAL